MDRPFRPHALRAAVLVAVIVAVAGCSSPPASVAPPNLEIVCSGEGAPTVILIPGMGTAGEVFESLQSQLETDTRVCSYSRAGLGQSPPWPLTEDDPSAGMAADQLRATLEKREVPGPFVLLGWSYGGLVAQAFAHRHREMSAGLVFEDSSVRSMFSQADFGIYRIEEGGRPIDAERTVAELADVNFSDLPTIVLTRGHLDDFDDAEMARWMAGHQELAALSTNSMHLIAVDAGHAIHWDSEALVEKSVEAVVDAVRNQAPLPECDHYEWIVYSGECREP